MHLRTSFSYIKRAPFQALAAIAVLTLTFFVATVVILLSYGGGRLLAYLETRPQVIAFLKKEATPQAADALLKRLSSDLRVKDIKYVSKEEALEIYKKVTSDNPLLGELVSPSIFPSSIEFSLKDLAHAQEIIDEVKKEGVVDNVGFTANLGGESTLDQAVVRLKNITLYTKLGGGVFVGLLGAVSLLVLLVIIGMRITTRRQELKSLSLLGASKGFIRTSILYEALIYVLSGVFLGWLLATVILLYATPSLMAYFEGVDIIPADTLSFFGMLGLVFLGELMVGLLVALLSTYFAVSRALSD